MRVKKIFELLVLGVASHSGCIVACLGAGLSGGIGCPMVVDTGHPLTYLFTQCLHLSVAILVAWAYWKIPKEVYRIPIMTILVALLWVPPATAMAGACVQAIFVMQMGMLLLSWLLPKFGVQPPSFCCCDKVEA